MDVFVRLGRAYISINKIESIYIDESKDRVVICMLSQIKHNFEPGNGENLEEILEDIHSKIRKAQYDFTKSIQNKST